MARERDEGRRRCDAGRRVTEHQSGFDRLSLNIPKGLGMWNPKKGSHKIEVIPYEVTKAIERYKLRRYADPGDLYFERTFFIHRGIGVNNDSVTCLAKTFGKKCPICEHRGVLARSPDKDTEKLIKALAPKERQLYLIVDLNEPDKGLQLFEVSHFAFGEQLEAKINNADEEDRARYRGFADPEDGLTLKLAASEEAAGETGKFLWFNVDEFRARREPLDPDWINHGFNLDEMVREMDYDEIKKMFLQTGDDDNEERGNRNASRGRSDDDDDAPPARRPAAQSRRSADNDDDPPPRSNKPSANGTAAKSEPAAECEWAVGDSVTFTYQKKEWVGKIVKVQPLKEIAHVDCGPDQDPIIVDFDMLKRTMNKPTKSARDAEDDDPAPRQSKATARDDDDDPPPRSRAAREPEPAPRQSKATARDDDDDPPPRSHAAREPEPAAAGKPRSRAGDDWDDDDDPPPRNRSK